MSGARCAELARRPPTAIVRDDGDVDRALAAAARTVEAVYELPVLTHAPMEPRTCTAHVTTVDGRERCEVWAPTQNPQAVQDIVAK